MTVVADAHSVSRAPVRSQAAHDRLFYGTMAVVLALVVFVGFGPTYYFRFLGSGPQATVTGGPITPLVHVHGFLFTAWVLLFIVQTALVATRRVAVHRRLGVAGAALAVAMIAIGSATAIATARRGGAPTGVRPAHVPGDSPLRHGALRGAGDRGAALTAAERSAQAAHAAGLHRRRRPPPSPAFRAYRRWARSCSSVSRSSSSWRPRSTI